MLGDNIKRIRKEKKISINALSKLSGISLGYLSDLENNRAKNPTMEKLQAISDALGVPLNAILTTEEKLELATNALENIYNLTKTVDLSDIKVSEDYSVKYEVTPRDKKQYLEHMKKANEAFFMDDEFNEDDKREILDAMTEIFWRAKSMNKRKPKDK